MDGYILDDIVVQAKGKVKGKGQGKGKSQGNAKTGARGARGGGKNRTRREAKDNKKTSCYSTKHARIQAEKVSKQTFK